MNTLQELIDSLAARLGQPVGIDDRRFRSLAYSSHEEEEIDPVRRRSILGRQAPRQVTDWLAELGIAQATGPVRVPGNPALEMVPRVCFPLRFHDRLLGYLWLTEARGPLDPALLDETEQFTSKVAEELFRLEQEDREEERHEGDTVVRLTTTGGQDGPADPSLASAPRYVVVVIDVDSDHARAETDVRLTAAADRVRRMLAPRHLLSRVDVNRALVVLAAPGEDDLEKSADALLAAAETEFSDLDDASVVAGVGDPVQELADLPTSARQADLAVRVARSASGHGPLAAWSRLEAYRPVAELADGRDATDLLPGSLCALLADADATTLVRTVETYLERGGDAAVASAELFIHRSSLYNRLRRVEQVAGIDMRCGADRLELHLGLRLWRLSQRSADIEPAPAKHPVAG